MTNGFTFRQFHVSHDRCAMKIGTDGVLLGAWARGGQRVLDIGCGSGLIALMMAQRFPQSMVDGVEIDTEAAKQARENVIASPFAARVEIFETPFQAFAPSSPYDAIVSNPPFFLSGHASPEEKRALARHAEHSFFDDLFTLCKCWLTPCGELSVIVPAEIGEQTEACAYLHGWLLSRRIGVRGTEKKPVERYLLAFVRKRSHGVELGEHCLQASDGSRMAWYRSLTAAFYR